MRRGMGRRGRPGLLGTMARTAVVAGTASAVVGGANNRQNQKAAAAAQNDAAQQAAFQSQAEIADLQSQISAMNTPQAAAPAAPAASAAPAGNDLIAELTQLGDLKAAGVLDDAEFAAAKAKLLAG